MNTNNTKKGLLNRSGNKRKSTKKRISKKTEGNESRELLKLNRKKKNNNH